MHNLKEYIIEKLKINKDTKIESLFDNIYRCLCFEQSSSKEKLIKEWIETNNINEVKIVITKQIAEKIISKKGVKIKGNEDIIINDRFVIDLGNKLFKDNDNNDCKLLLLDDEAIIVGNSRYLAINNKTILKNNGPNILIVELNYYNEISK